MVSSSSPNNLQTIHCGFLVNAAGPNAGHLARKLEIHLPVEPRKRYVFVLDCPEVPERDEMPLVVDCTGTYVRPESGCFLSGVSPAKVSVLITLQLCLVFELVECHCIFCITIKKYICTSVKCIFPENLVTVQNAFSIFRVIDSSSLLR